MILFDIKIDNISRDDALDKINRFLLDGKQYHLATINPDFFVLAQKDADFKNILKNTNLNLADGFGVCLAGRFAGKKIERVTGADLAEEILKSEGKKIFLLGGENGAAQKIANKYSAVAGFSESLAGAVELINNCRPNVLLVALGPPKQEKWIAQNLAKMPSVKVAIGVGGAFKFLSDQVRRAPKWLRRIGLEWVWRTVMEPRRIVKTWRSVAVFGWMIIKENLKIKAQMTAAKGDKVTK